MDKPQAFDYLAGDLGFGDNKENQEALEKQTDKRMEIAKMFHAVFTTGQGPELLQYLRDQTIEVSFLDVHLKMINSGVAMSPADWAYLCEGQNSIIRLIENQVEFATKPAPNDEPQQPKED